MSSERDHRTGPTEAPSDPLVDALGRLRAAGIERIESYGWRDLDDPEAGGSEVHADEIFSRWAAAGLAVHHRTSTFDKPRTFERHGYRVTQRGGRFDVFARVILRQLWRRRPRGTATIEIWNGVPWCGPIWAPRRRVVWLHHVHREMWDDVLPRPLNHLGRIVETRIAPLLYRRSQLWTPSESSAAEIRALGISPSRLAVVPNGVHERFTPDDSVRSPTPNIAIVGRLAAVKRHRLALDAALEARRSVPDLTVDVVGDGPDRQAVTDWVGEHSAESWVTVHGRVEDASLVRAYQRAWIVLSASYAEGWGMSLTEAGACGTPCVATDIAGHRGAAVDEVTGLLVPPDRLGEAIVRMLGDEGGRAAMGLAAIDHAAALSWDSIAARHLDVLTRACTR